MPIKAVILDLDGTLVQSAALVPGVEAMIERLQEYGLEVFVASNEPRLLRTERMFPSIPAENFLYQADLAAKKGTGRFVDTVCSRMEITPNTLVYLGDSDNDMREAVRRNVALFLAAWSEPTYRYGLPVTKPSHFADIIEAFFLKERLWYYKVDGADGEGRPVIVRGLLSATDTINSGVQSLLKSGGAVEGGKVGRLSLKAFLSYHLLASIYLEGLHLRGTQGKPMAWTVYPGHAGGQTGVLSEFSALVSRLLREQNRSDLLVRHKPAIKLAYARARQEHPSIGNQFQTVMLNPVYRDKIEGRTIIVLDDFTTFAHSFETARNLLMSAGAKEVVCIAVGKYRMHYSAHVPKPGVVLNGFSPNTLDTPSFDQLPVEAVTDPAAAIVFEFEE